MDIPIYQGQSHIAHKEKLMEILIAAFLVFVVCACFGIGSQQENTKQTPVPNIPAGYVVIASETKVAEQQSGCGTILMLWGVFTIFLFVVMFS